MRYNKRRLHKESEAAVKLLSVNVSMPREITARAASYRSGIYKEAQSAPVRLGRLHLEGDGQADLKAHGGVNRAVYCYPYEHYAYWAGELGRDDFAYGQFGENLTTAGLLESAVCIGSVYRVGSAVIQVTQPRVPCFKLADKMGIPGFAKTFLRANRPGFYARVLEEGAVAAGDRIALLQEDAVGMSVAAVNHCRHFDRANRAAIERALCLTALSPEWRRAFEALLGAG